MSGTPTPPRRRKIAGERRPAGAPATTATAPPAPQQRVPEEKPTRPARPERVDNRGPIGVLTLLIAGSIAALLVVGAVFYGLPKWTEVADAKAEERDGRAATAAAERASLAILSYHYKTLEADEAAALRFMTSKMIEGEGNQPGYRETFESSIIPNAPLLKANVDAELKASGVMNVSGGRVDVLLYVNQTTVSTANGGDPQVALNRVIFRMVEVDGSWLVDEIIPK